MASNEIRPIVKLRSTTGTGYTYITRKNRRNDPDRLVLRKYGPVIRRRVNFGRDRPRAVELCCGSGYPEEEKGLTG
jgi:large subunit ribosomal protein L33